jgi:flagellar basal-body rod modification protein FlgD
MSLDLAALGLNAAAAAPGTTSRGVESLGQKDFLNLLVAQLRNQDPLNPLDNEAFVAQLAQFSTVSGISEMNQSLGRLAALAGGSARSDAPGWIGRRVAAEDGTGGTVASVGFAADGSLVLNLEGGANLPAAAVSTVA